MPYNTSTNTTSRDQANLPEANTTQQSLLESAIEAAYEKASECQRNRDYANAIYYFLEALRGEFDSSELIDAAQIAVEALKKEINESGSSQGQENIGPKQNYIEGHTAYRSNRLFSEKIEIKATINNNDANISATSSDAKDALNTKLSDVDHAITNIKNRSPKNLIIHRIDHLLNRIEAHYFPKKPIPNNVNRPCSPGRK